MRLAHDFQTPHAYYTYMDASHGIDALHRHFQDPKLYDLAAGFLRPPTRESLPGNLSQEKYLWIWHLQPHPPCQAQGYAVYSRVTALHYISIYFWEGGFDFEVWKEGFSALIERVFAHVPHCERLFTDIPLPLPEGVHDALMDLGFEPRLSEIGKRVKSRATFVLPREIYTLYQTLYQEMYAHQPGSA